MRRYRLVSVNDRATTCALCGKTDLKRVFWLQESDASGADVGVAVPYGSECASRLMAQRLQPTAAVVMPQQESLAYRVGYGALVLASLVGTLGVFSWLAVR